MAFFEWGSLNSAQFDTLIADCEKIKADLDKLDLNCAQLYATRCKRSSTKSLRPAKNLEDLLALMKVGGWLTAKEALDWGFVDEITDLADEPAPRLTDALASAMASEGMPIPNIPISEADKESAFAKFISALTSFFRPQSNHIATAMNKTYTFLCAVLGITALELTDNRASLSDEQLSALENHIADLGKKVEDRDKTIADLKAKLDAKPAATTTTVVEDQKPGGETAPKNEVEAFVDTYNSARQLFNEV